MRRPIGESMALESERYRQFLAERRMYFGYDRFMLACQRFRHPFRDQLGGIPNPRDVAFRLCARASGAGVGNPDHVRMANKWADAKFPAPCEAVGAPEALGDLDY